MSGGPFVSFLLSAKYITSGQSYLYADPAGTQKVTPIPIDFNHTEDIKSQTHMANVGLEGNVGFMYRKGRHNIFIEGGGNYGFLNIQKGSANGKNNTGAATLAVGYCHWLGK